MSKMSELEFLEMAQKVRFARKKYYLEIKEGLLKEVEAVEENIRQTEALIEFAEKELKGLRKENNND